MDIIVERRTHTSKVASNKLADTRIIEDAGEKTESGLYITSSNILTTIVDANMPPTVGMWARREDIDAMVRQIMAREAREQKETIRRAKETGQEAAAMQQRNI
jgi:hypothetical protein